MNDRERQQCLEDIETIKRLSAEKEALLIQKSLNQVRKLLTFMKPDTLIIQFLRKLPFRVEDRIEQTHLVAPLNQLI